jgi:hypothetical protein
VLESTDPANSVFHAILHGKNILETMHPMPKAQLPKKTKWLRYRAVKVVMEKMQRHVLESSIAYHRQFLVATGSSRGEFSWKKYAHEMAVVPNPTAWGDLAEAHASALALNCQVQVYRRAGQAGMGFKLVDTFAPTKRPGYEIVRILRVNQANGVPIFHTLWPAIIADYQTAPSRFGHSEFMTTMARAAGRGGVAAVDRPENALRNLEGRAARASGPMSNLLAEANDNFNWSGSSALGRRHKGTSGKRSLKAPRSRARGTARSSFLSGLNSGRDSGRASRLQSGNSGNDLSGSFGERTGTRRSGAWR